MPKVNFRKTFKRFPEYSDAIIALRPGSAFGINMNEYTSLYWDPQNESQPPSEDEIKTKLVELISEWELVEYRRQRYLEYAPLEEQMALLWDDMDAGLIPGKETSNWYAAVKEIKDKYPLPE